MPTPQKVCDEDNDICLDVTSPELLSAASVKTHGDPPGVPNVDLGIDMPLAGDPAVECRVGGPTEIVLSFSEPIKAADGSVDCGAEVAITNGTCNSASINGSDLEIDVSSGDAVCLEVTVAGIADMSDNPAGDIDVQLKVLLGDTRVDINNLVNIFDFALVKANLFGPLSPTGRRCDVNVDGIINIHDMSQLKANLFAKGATCP